MKIGIVIPTYNREKNLRCLLKTLELQSHTDFYVIIVDSGSSDNTRGLISEKKKEVFWEKRLAYIYAGDARVGKPARSRNIGVGMLPEKCELAYFLDSDVLLNENILEDVARVYEENDDCIIMPQTFWMKPQDIEFIEEKVENGTYLDFFKTENYKKPHIEEGSYVGWELRFELNNNPFDDQKIKRMRGEWLLLLNVAFPRKMLKEIGPLDEDMKGHGYEDIEYGLRAEKLMKNVVTINYPGGVHMWHAKEYDEKRQYIENQANLHYVMCKNPEKDLVDIDWKIWWHYMKRRGGSIYKDSEQGYWLVDRDRKHRLHVEEGELYNTDYRILDVKGLLNLDDYKKIQNMGNASFEYNEYIVYKYFF